LRNPMSALRVVELCRSVIISAKEYGKFKPFLIRIYNYLQRNNLLNETNKIIERDFLFMITHTLYRSKDFEGASNFLKELETSLDFSGEIFDLLLGKAISLKAAILFCQGRVEESIVILKRTLDNKTIRIDPKEKLNMEVNLGVYYFFSKKYVECNHYIQRLPLKSASMEALLGQEWFFKRDLIEVIVQSELEKVDIAHQRLRAVRRDYDELLAEPNYKRAGEFINLIEIYFQSPEKIRTPEFMAQVEKIRSGWHNQAEDIQALMFFSWYRSKMLGRDCYELFLERLLSNMEEMIEE
jgi:tetratricopeptide (TPR) repeat protein